MDARYFLATSYGLRSSFAITIDHSLREAFSNGNRAYASTKKLIQENPAYYDAYLTVGIYEYIVGSIPWYWKWMIFVIGARGNKQDGMEHLKLAAEAGQYIKNEAQLVLMVLYVREHRFAEALEIARRLNERYPRSFLFPINLAQILRMSGRKEQALALLLQVENKVASGEPNFDKLPLQSFRYNLGLELMAMGQGDAAEERFRKAIHDPQTQKREKALSHLQLGKILDRKGRHKEAAGEYEVVLSLENVENSHGQARQLLQKASPK
jgi:tetratricopeptide (TPR) repeat protein